jgi:DNA polymerase III epsilon subunit-like protein
MWICSACQHTPPAAPTAATAAPDLTPIARRRARQARARAVGAFSTGARDTRAMSYVMVDVEADGPAPGLYSMVSFGAVLVRDGLDQTFYGQLRPISEAWLPDALAVSGHSRAEHEQFADPATVMAAFARWIADHGGKRPIFISDNNGFDWSFINYYFHRFHSRNPFGHSSQNLGSLYKGVVKDTFANFKHLRKTRHTHHPVDDARGNAEALLAIQREHGLKISFD